MRFFGRSRSPDADRVELMTVSSSSGTDAHGSGAPADARRSGARAKIKALQAQIGEVREVMVDNIDKVLVRKEKLDKMEADSARLAETAQHFHHSARTVKRRMFWRNVKYWLAVTGTVLLVAGVVVLVAVL